MAEEKLEEIKKIRIEKIKKLLDLGINPYPSKPREDPIDIESARGKSDQEVCVCGRVMSIRSHGNVGFFDLKDETGKIQLWFQKDILKDSYKIIELLDVGDILFAKGAVTKTKAGEISINVSDFQLLSKSIRPLPSNWFGVKDIEDRYRKRYLDLIFNEEVRKRFNTRTLLVREVRNYLDGLGFWEVETPTLQPLYGGANAKPFKTRHQALDHNFYLRIADELYLKRLIVGGYKKVYEICKDFRNEGIDQTHSPEFTMIEYYESYADYQRVMDVTEGLFKHLAEKVFGEMKIKVGEKDIDISQKWPRISMIELIKKHLNLDVEKENENGLVEFCKDNHIEILGGETKGQLIYSIFEHKVTDLLEGPVWVVDYPKDVSPLSKDHPEKSGWVERFEGYIGGKEICDGWSELTDPREQRARFENDVKLTRSDREEAQQVDEDFLEAIEYGMPPLGGIGIGIDRLTMFFTNCWAIKEVILFPTLRPLDR
jgi:lysyl-tRNA synthetase class 2